MINHEKFSRLEFNKRGENMINRQNIILMFLIVMLSFAMVTEVSAVESDDAEPGESCLNGPHGSFNSYGPPIPSERLDEVSYGSNDDTLNNPHSNNSKTSIGDVPSGTDENMNLYESSHDETHELEGHNIDEIITFDGKDIKEGEIMNPHLRFNEFNPPRPVYRQSLEGISEFTSQLIGANNLSVAFKNNRRGYLNILPEFNGVLPQEIPNDIIVENFDFKGDFNQFDGDLFSENITPNKLNSFLPNNMENISLLNIELPEINDAIPTYSLLNDFLPEINEMQGLKHTHFPNSNIHNNMPDWNSNQNMI